MKMQVQETLRVRFISSHIQSSLLAFFYYHRRRVDDYSLYFFPFVIKYYHIMSIIIVFRYGNDRPSGLLFFVPALLSILTPLFLPSSSVSLSFILAVPMRECLGKHLFMSSQFPIAILNGTFFFREARQSLFWPKLRLSKSNHATSSS